MSQQTKTPLNFTEALALLKWARHVIGGLSVFTCDEPMHSKACHDLSRAIYFLEQSPPAPAQPALSEPELPQPQLLVEAAQGFVEGWTKSQVRSAINLAVLKQRYAQPALTDEQIAKCMLAVDDPVLWGRLVEGQGDMIRAFARAIESAVRGQP